MHELAYAGQILSFVECEALKHQARKVSLVRLKMGKYSGLDKDSLSFCLEAISAGTMMESARIEIENIEPEFTCQSCRQVFCSGEAAFVCPICGNEAKLSSGTEIYIQEVELELDDDED